METIQEIVLSKRGKFDGIAVETSDSSLGYREFDELTDRFAKGLSDMGAGPGDSIVLFMKRSIDMVVALFGILKSGAAIVPIVSNFPQKRLESVAASSGAKFIVDDKFYQDLMEKTSSGALDFQPRMAGGDDPAIVLYTSGSTGTPKGVSQNQGAVAFLFEQFPDRIASTGIVPKDFDNVIGRLNHGFIVAYHYEYPTALLNGKKLILLSEEEQSSILNTSEFLEANEKCLMAILPSQLSMYLENERFCRAMKNVSCLGFFAEPIPEALKRKLLEMKEFQGSIISVFGQTETFGIGWQDFRKDTGMVISPEVTVRTIDPDEKLLPPGERGELIVSSPTLFTKYLLEDREKAASIFDEKNIEIDGVRFVRTGDIGVVDAQGVIKLAGRNDRMVKYHGQRIELAEIEAVMKDYPGIRNCCTIITKGKNDNDVMVAYYEGEHDQDVDLKVLRSDMMELLPAYMIPVYIIRIDKIPLNTNGKVDYTTLKNREIDYDNIGDHRQLTEVEKLIADKAAGLLNMDPEDLHADSNLMALGMDSLNAVLLINDLAEKGFGLSIEDFITSLTIEDLAAKLGKKRAQKKELKQTSELVWCTDMQTFWIRNNLQVVANIVGYRGIEEEELARKAEMLPKLHSALRSTFVEDGGEIYTKVLKNRPMRYEYLDIRDRGDGTPEISDVQRKIISVRSQLLFSNPDLADLLFVLAIRTHDDKTVLDIRFDHRVVDAVGEKILFQELLTADELTGADNYIEYLDYTADEKVRNEALQFWKSYLSGVELACVPKNPSCTGTPNYKKYGYTLGPDKAEILKGVCRKRNISISAYVLCQYARAVMDVLEKDDIVVPMGVSGRSLPLDGIDKMLGCLVNAVPVRIRRSDSERDFMKSYLQADQYGFLQQKVIFRECFGMEEVPKISPYIVAQIFPEYLVKEKYEYFETPSFNLFNMGEFLWEDAEGIHLLMHPDIDLWDKACIDRILARTEELLEKGIEHE